MNNHKNLLKGVLIGGAIAGVIGLMVAPKSGRNLRDDLTRNYNSMNKKAHDFSDDLVTSTRKLLGKEEVEDSDSSSLLIGALIGTILGGIAALLLAPDSGKKLREKLGSQYETIYEKAEDFISEMNSTGHDTYKHLENWKDTLGTLIEKLSVPNSKAKGKNSKLNEIADWAGLGLHLFQQLQKRS